MRQTSILPAPRVAPCALGLCRLLRAPAGCWTFPTLSLPSLWMCPDPYPVVSARCTYPFLPQRQRPHISHDVFGTRDDPCNATSTGGGFRGCSHSFTFGLTHSLGPQIAPTTGRSTGQPGRLRHASPGQLPGPRCGIATCLIWATGTAGPSPARWQPCRLLPVTFLPHPPHIHSPIPDDIGLRTSTLPRPWNHASHAIRVPRVRSLPAASFRSHLAMGTLAVRLEVPVIRPPRDLHPQVTSRSAFASRLPAPVIGATRHAWRTPSRPGEFHPEHRVVGGSHPPPTPSERSVPISGTALFEAWFTAQQELETSDRVVPNVVAVAAIGL